MLVKFLCAVYYYLKGMFALIDNRRFVALKYLTHALKCDASNKFLSFNCHKYIGICYVFDHRYDEARKYFALVENSSRAKNDFEFNAFQAEILKQEQVWEKSIMFSQRALNAKRNKATLFCKESMVHLNMGYCYYHVNDIGKAKIHYKKFLELADRNQHVQIEKVKEFLSK